MALTISKHSSQYVTKDELSYTQEQLLNHPAQIRIAAAPTGAGKSFVFQRAMARQQQRILFMVPTKRLVQNQYRSLFKQLTNKNQGGEGWSEKQAQAKIALWTADETLRLKNLGITQITTRRLLEMLAVNERYEGGEMIFAVPETVNHLLLRPYPQQGLPDNGIFDLLYGFDHIVFDEFHTIQARGFGLAAVLARLAVKFAQEADDGVIAKINFLSATPINIMPVLNQLGLQNEEVAFLEEKVVHEAIGSQGRMIHGDVVLNFENVNTIPTLMSKYADEIKAQVGKSRQVVVIYNKLEDLHRQITELENAIRQADISPESCLLIDSISDSRPFDWPQGHFAVGRQQQPEQFQVLITTSSVEMGVNFEADLLLMEPGFEAMNFLQRYGRAARGEYDGQVIVRYDDELLRGNEWLSDVLQWYENYANTTQTINTLTDILCSAGKSTGITSVQKRFDDHINTSTIKYFTKLSVRASYAAGLYWHVLQKHFSHQKHRNAHLFKYRPRVAREIEELLNQVLEMKDDKRFGLYAKKWYEEFERQALTLRDIEPRIRVIEPNGKPFTAPYSWLRNKTWILDLYPLIIGKDGVEEIHSGEDLHQAFLQENRYEPKTKEVYFPNTGMKSELIDDYQLVDRWCQALEEQRGPEKRAWRKYPKSMEAAIELVRRTGLVVSEYPKQLDSYHTILD
jgi:CRISPR-associated endonuclease/helicase Cas3